MPIKKIIEVIATSEKGFDDATQNAVNEAAKSVQNIKSIYVKDMNAKVDDNKIISYGIIAKVTFEVDDTKRKEKQNV